MTAAVVAGVAVGVAVLLGHAALGGLRAAAAEGVVRRRVRAASPDRSRIPGWARSAGAGGSMAPDWGDRWGRVSRFVGRGAAGRERRSDRDLPALLDQVTRHLRSGAALPMAVQSAAARRRDPATAGLAEELAAGAPIAGAVAHWHDACPTPARGLAAAALTLAAEAGGSVAVVLDGVTDTLRDRVALDREVAALSSQARASAAVLVVAPVVFAVLAAAADHRVAEVLLGQPLGWACLLGGAVLDSAGALWMSRLVGRSR